jgi:hypothetical protein
MSEYPKYLVEREQINFLIQQGFEINQVIENLSGSFVIFKSKETDDFQQLLITTADARKYFSSLLIKSKIKN